MRSRTTTWFETKIRYTKTHEDGRQKPVTEQYVVDALSFSEAEAAIFEEMKDCINSDYKITDIRPAAFHEIFFSDLDKDDRWYKAKLQFVTIDEKTEKEKRTNIIYLVQSATLNGAVKNIDEIMGGTTINYALVSINETSIMDVFEHDLKSKDRELHLENSVPEYMSNGSMSKEV
ncbi:MAG: DUF4494 domain-containing protein [Prevotellaceae bacterium]|nr:DUF4494 domain-containing protein [Prevotellaceae bacterium]